MVQRTHVFAEHQTLWLNIQLVSITWNFSNRRARLRRDAKAISPKPPKVQTAKSAGGHDVIECEDCRETITSCSCCVEESLLRLAVKQSQFGTFLLFFSLPILHLFVVVHESVNQTYGVYQSDPFFWSCFYRLAHQLKHSDITLIEKCQNRLRISVFLPWRPRYTQNSKSLWSWTLIER